MTKFEGEGEGEGELKPLPSNEVSETEVAGDAQPDADAVLGGVTLPERMRTLRKATPRSEHLEALTLGMLKDELAGRGDCAG